MKTSHAMMTLLLLIPTAAMAQEGDIFVAGVAPSHRPDSAPEITQVGRAATWYEQGLAGVTKPYPESLYFLERQGNWFTPFIHPGMTGPYDIRGWHKP